MLKKPHKDLKFAFDQVYGPQHNNEEIFTGTILPMLDTILNGFNCSGGFFILVWKKLLRSKDEVS